MIHTNSCNLGKNDARAANTENACPLLILSDQRMSSSKIVSEHDESVWVFFGAANPRPAKPFFHFQKIISKQILKQNGDELSFGRCVGHDRSYSVRSRSRSNKSFPLCARATILSAGYEIGPMHVGNGHVGCDSRHAPIYYKIECHSRTFRKSSVVFAKYALHGNLLGK